MDKYYFYQSYYEALKGLKASTRYAIREAIDRYMFDDEEPEFKDTLSKSIWMLIVPTLRISKIRYANAKQNQSKPEAKSKQNGSKTEANAKQNQSKMKANAKQNESKPEAKSKQNESKDEGNPQVCSSISISKDKGLRIKDKGESIMDKGEKEREEKRSATASPVSRFSKPTVEQIKQLVAEKGYHFDADAFHAFYESKGWKVGNQPMKSWEAACVTWEKREPHPEQKEEVQEEYHPITPLEQCKVCGTRNVSTRGIYSKCLDCGVSYLWNSPKGDWQEEC